MGKSVHEDPTVVEEVIVKCQTCMWKIHTPCLFTEGMQARVSTIIFTGVTPRTGRTHDHRGRSQRGRKTRGKHTPQSATVNVGPRKKERGLSYPSFRTCTSATYSCVYLVISKLASTIDLLTRPVKHFSMSVITYEEREKKKGQVNPFGITPTSLHYTTIHFTHLIPSPTPRLPINQPPSCFPKPSVR